MNMKIKNVVISILLTFPILLSGCSSREYSSSSSSKHEHTFTEQWSYDEQFHWHEATCGHDVISEKEEHIFGRWHLQNNEKYRICEVCDYKEIEIIGEDFYVELFDFTLNEDKSSYSIKGKNVLEGESNSHIFGDIIIPDFYNGMPVTRVEDKAFWYCSEITSLVIGDNITEIGTQAFFYNRNLTNVDTGLNVVSFGDSAFCYCHIEELLLHDNLQSIGDSCFSINLLPSELIIPKSVKHFGMASFWYCSVLESLKVVDENPYFASKDGVVYTKDFREIVVVPQRKTETIEIPNNLEVVGPGAFYDNDNLKEFISPETLVSIKTRAFIDCSQLTKVTFANGLLDVGEWAFFGCNKIKVIDIPLKVTRIEECTFAYCSSLEKVKLSESIKYLGHEAFKGDKSLASIEFSGTIEQWYLIEKENDWCDATLQSIICANGVVEA